MDNIKKTEIEDLKLPSFIGLKTNGNTNTNVNEILNLLN